MKWSSHANHRWRTRFPGIDKGRELLTAGQVSRKNKTKIRNLCPKSSQKYMKSNAIYTGRYFLLGQLFYYVRVVVIYHRL